MYKLFSKIKLYFEIIINKIYWSMPFGTVVELPWPTQPTSDPNDCWRPYLEEHVGHQSISWDWRIGQGVYAVKFSTIDIKFRREKDATMFVLKYGH